MIGKIFPICVLLSSVCYPSSADLNSIVTYSFSNGNLVRNGSFESSHTSWGIGGEKRELLGWNVDGIDFNLQAQVKPVGGLKHAAYDLDASAAFRGLKSEFFPLTSGKAYIVSFWYQGSVVQGSVQGSVLTYLDKSGEVGETIHFLGTSYSNTSTWTKVEATITAPTNAQFGRICLLHSSAAAKATLLFDDVVVFESGLPSPGTVYRKFEFFDGMNRSIQTVVPDGNADIVTQNFYDSKGRLEKVSLPIGDDFQTINGRHDFLPGITAATGQGSDLLDSYYIGAFINGTYFPDAGGSSFTQTVYENNSLNRVKETALPGASWVIGGEHTTKTTHSSAENLSMGGVEDPYDPSKTSLYEYGFTKGMDGEKSWFFKDGLGREVRKGVSKSQGNKVETDYSYDGLDNLTKVTPPANENGFRFTSEQDFNTLSLRTSETTRSTGTTKYIYDQAGKVRFVQDADQRLSRKFGFTQYDELGRVLVTGEVTYPSGNDQFTQTNADIRGYPGRFYHSDEGGISVKVRNVYQYDLPPANTNGCQVDESQGERLLVVSENGSSANPFFPTLNNAYDHLVATINNQPISETVVIYQVYDDSHVEFEPLIGSEFVPVPVEGEDARGFEIRALRKGTSEYVAVMDRVLNGPIRWGTLMGRLVKVTSYNHNLAEIPAIGEKEVSVVYNYDTFGNITETYAYNDYVDDLDKKCVLTKNRFDAQNRVSSKTVCLNKECESAVSSENYSYDHLGQLTRIANDFGETIVENEFDRLGRVKSQSLGGGAADNSPGVLNARSFRHLHGQPERHVIHEKSSGSLLYREDLRYEAAKSADDLASWGEVNPINEASLTTEQARFGGGIARKTQAFNQSLADDLSTGTEFGFDYWYDGLFRLKDALGFGQGHTPLPMVHSNYTYLDDGRISTMSRGSNIGTYQYDDASPLGTGRLLGVSGNLVPGRNLVNAFNYYEDGNMRNDDSKNFASGDFAIYREDNLPYTFQTGNSGALSRAYMAYDAEGRRVSKFVQIAGQEIVSQHYFPGSVEFRSGSDGVESYDLAGMGRIIFNSVTGQYESEYYLQDHLGSTALVFNSTRNTIVQAISYFPYGSRIDDINTNSSIAGVTPKFSGKELDESMELVYFGARYYDADIGLWISPDPMRQFHSPYATSGNPINNVDPDGLEEVPANFIGPLQQQDWREGDQAGFAEAALFNLQNGLSGEYKTIPQRADFYAWFGSTVQVMGHDVWWPSAASKIAGDMVSIANWFGGPWSQFANAGNKAIFDDVFPELQSLYSSPSLLRGMAAEYWDARILHREQFVIAQPLYLRTPYTVINTMQNGSALFGFRGNLMSPGDRWNFGMSTMNRMRSGR